MNELTKKYQRVLSIAGSDSGGGAGIQADLKTFSALGCYGMTAVTAVTVQNTAGVDGVHDLPVAVVAEQIQAVLKDIGADAIKIGMLSSVEIIHAVASALNEHMPIPVVLDPVMAASSGDRLLADAAVSALSEVFQPISTLLTPNVPELAVLVDRDVQSMDDVKIAGRELIEMGWSAVLVKGGHLKGDTVTDILFQRGKDNIEISNPRILTANTHGTGCTLSSAIAAYLAKGEELGNAVREAEKYLSEAIEAGARYEIGSGNGPVCHFYNSEE